MRSSPAVMFLPIASLLLAPVALAAGDCPYPGAPPDPDGTARRLEVSRATALLTASHPVTLGTAVRSGGTPVTRRGLAHASFVDDEILGALEQAGVPPAPLSSDTEFLRRVTLDLIGRIPDAAAVTAFVNDPAPDKRARKIDELLAADTFNDRWALFLDDLYKNTFNADNGKLGISGRNAFHAYFVDALRSRKPYDQIARELLAGIGDNSASGSANFALRSFIPTANGVPIQDTYDNIATTAGTALLGTNAFFCSSCHDGAGHMDTINLWGSQLKRQNTWELSAFFARVSFQRLDNTPGNNTFLVSDRNAGDYNLNTTTGNKTTRQACSATVTTNCWYTEPAGLKSITPRYLVTAADGTPSKPGQGLAPDRGEAYRTAAGRLLTADVQFARATANTLWKELFTLGLVEPADGFDLARLSAASPPPAPWGLQPTHPQLLDRLAAELRNDGFDLRSFLRLLTRSSAYQLSSYYPGTWSEAYTPLFARHFVRRLGSEMLFDAITKATGVPASLTVAGASPVAWAVQLPDVTEPRGGTVRPFLDTFLRGDRDSDARSYTFSVSQALSMMNDTNVTNRVKGSNGTVDTLVKAKATPATIVDTLYLATLSRPPSDAERTAALALFTGLTAGQTTRSVAEDLQHALLNKLDFVLKY